MERPNEAQIIVGKLWKRGMTQKSIAIAINSHQETISRIIWLRRKGTRLLPKLRALWDLSNSP